MLNVSYYYSKLDENIDNKLISVRSLCEINEIKLVEICKEVDSEVNPADFDHSPVAHIGPYVLHSPFTDTELLIAIKAAKEKYSRENPQRDYAKTYLNENKFTRMDKFSLWFSRFYVLIISIIIGIYTVVAFAAPILEIKGQPEAANVVYKFYSVLCHQLAFRSFFIGGYQPFYPRELANVHNMDSYEKAIGISAFDISFAREFIGNEHLGYKVALCERDITIYGSLSLSGFIFLLTKKKLKPYPWYLWVIFALMPIAIDGISQLPGISSGWPTWLPIRESTPLLRVITGALFGGGTGLYMYPLMEESMRETRQQLLKKKLVLKKIQTAEDKI